VNHGEHLALSHILKPQGLRIKKQIFRNTKNVVKFLARGAARFFVIYTKTFFLLIGEKFYVFKIYNF